MNANFFGGNVREFVRMAANCLIGGEPSESLRCTPPCPTMAVERGEIAVFKQMTGFGHEVYFAGEVPSGSHANESPSPYRGDEPRNPSDSAM